MIKKTFNNVDENIYYEKLSNGLEIYLYPTNKTKNFYITISVKYGSRVTKYKLKDKTYDIIPGSAHFLEHKVMALSENKEISNRINNLGSLANAWTNYYGTNYNIYGSINIKENLKLLLDIFYNPNITEKNVIEEKGIIGEEIDMYKDKIDRYMYQKAMYNTFNTSYVRNTIVGERSDIEKITASSLNKIYKDFYIPNNTFIIVCGNFNENEILNDIKNYMDKINIKPKELPKIISSKEKNEVNVSYEEIKKDFEDPRVKYTLKMDIKNFNIKDEEILKTYMGIIMSSNFSQTSKLYEKYKNNNIIISMSNSISIISGYLIISIDSKCKDSNLFIENIKKDIKNLTLTEEEFERKKKKILKSFILEFDSIEDIEYDICYDLIKYNKVNYDTYNDIKNMEYKEAISIIDNIKYDNISILKTIR